MDPQPFKEWRVIIPTEELESLTVPFIVRLREEGISERIVMEWAILAWSEVNCPASGWFYQCLTPKEVISRMIHEIFIGDHLLTHLDSRDQSMLLIDAYEICRHAYSYFSRYLDPHEHTLVDNESVMIERWDAGGSMVIILKVDNTGIG